MIDVATQNPTVETQDFDTQYDLPEQAVPTRSIATQVSRADSVILHNKGNKSSRE